MRSTADIPSREETEVLNSKHARRKPFIAVPVPWLLLLHVGADNTAPRVVDSQSFLLQNLTPAGPATARFSERIDKLLSEMTLKEKVGQMTQLELSMITDGIGQDVRIDPEKLHKESTALTEQTTSSVRPRFPNRSQWRQPGILS